MGITKSAASGTGFLVLFALPFTIGGVVSFVAAMTQVSTWHAMRHWEPVPAQVLSADLEARSGKRATTYKATATYRYRYAGTLYDGSRVGIADVADNFGDFHERVYRELQSAQRAGRPVTVYVDPLDPANATVSRELRWLLLTVEGLFAAIFGGIGFGVLIGGALEARTRAAERTLQRRFPNEPWRWRRQWAHGRIKGADRSRTYAAIAFATIWNVIALPAAGAVPREIANGSWLALLAMLFPLVGLALAAWAIRAWLRFRRFKVATLVLKPMPAELGARLQGTIKIEACVPVIDEFALELRCLEWRRSKGKASEQTLWRTATFVPKRRCELTSTYSAIPVDIPIRPGLPATGRGDDGVRVTWQLDARGSCLGPDFSTRFEVPVFEIAKASA